MGSLLRKRQEARPTERAVCRSRFRLVPVAGDFGLCDGRAADATLEGDPLPRRCCTVTESSLYAADASAIEVLIYRGDQLIARALCESEEDAAAVVHRWSELRNVSFLVDDLTQQHGP